MKKRLHNMICGAGTLLDILPSPQIQRLSVAEKILGRSDAQAIYGDWEKVGADFWAALGQVKLELNGNNTGPSNLHSRDSVRKSSGPA